MGLSGHVPANERKCCPPKPCFRHKDVLFLTRKKTSILKGASGLQIFAPAPYKAMFFQNNHRKFLVRAFREFSENSFSLEGGSSVQICTNVQAPAIGRCPNFDKKTFQGFNVELREQRCDYVDIPRRINEFFCLSQAVTAEFSSFWKQRKCCS